jgi:hypothetical protein
MHTDEQSMKLILQMATMDPTLRRDDRFGDSRHINRHPGAGRDPATFINHK